MHVIRFSRLEVANTRARVDHGGRKMYQAHIPFRMRLGIRYYYACHPSMCKKKG